MTTEVEKNEIKERLEKLIQKHIAPVRDELKKELDGSARADELKAQLDKIYEDYMPLQEERKAMDTRIEALETALSRVGSSDDAKDAPETVEYKQAFNSFLKKNTSLDEVRAIERKMIEKKLLQIGVDPDGGVRAPEDVTGLVIQQVYETSPMRQIAAVRPTSRSSVVLYSDLDEAGGGWEGENQTQAETTTPQLGKIEIPVHKVAAEPHATEEMLADADFDAAAWLSDKVSSKLSRLQNTAFVSGNGVTRPRGFVTYTAGTDLTAQQIEQVTTATATVFDEDDLTTLIGSLKVEYRSNASWVMSRLTHKNMFSLKDTNGDFLFDLNGLRDMVMWSYPIVVMEDLADPTSGTTYANNALPIAFGDFRRGYHIADRAGLSVIVDNVTSKGKTKYYTVARVGGGVVNFEAFKILKIKST